MYSATATPEVVLKEPLESDQVGIVRLLRRAGFGASQAEFKQFTDMGRSAAIDHLIDYENVDGQPLENGWRPLSWTLNAYATYRVGRSCA